MVIPLQLTHNFNNNVHRTLPDSNPMALRNFLCCESRRGLRSCEGRAWFESANDPRFPAPSSGSPLPCSPASWKGYDEGCGDPSGVHPVSPLRCTCRSRLVRHDTGHAWLRPHRLPLIAQGHRHVENETPPLVSSFLRNLESSNCKPAVEHSKAGGEGSSASSCVVEAFNHVQGWRNSRLGAPDRRRCVDNNHKAVLVKAHRSCDQQGYCECQAVRRSVLRSGVWVRERSAIHNARLSGDRVWRRDRPARNWRTRRQWRG